MAVFKDGMALRTYHIILTLLAVIYFFCTMTCYSAKLTSFVFNRDQAHIPYTHKTKLFETMQLLGFYSFTF